MIHGHANKEGSAAMAVDHRNTVRANDDARRHGGPTLACAASTEAGRRSIRASEGFVDIYGGRDLS